MHKGGSAFSDSAVDGDRCKSCTSAADEESAVPSAATISAASEGGSVEPGFCAAVAGEAVAAFVCASTDAMPLMRGLSHAVVCVGWREGVPRALWIEHGAGVLPSALTLVLRFPA